MEDCFCRTSVKADSLLMKQLYWLGSFLQDTGLGENFSQPAEAGPVSHTMTRNYYSCEASLQVANWHGENLDLYYKSGVGRIARDVSSKFQLKVIRAANSINLDSVHHPQAGL